MKSSSPIQKIKDTFHEEDWPTVVPALRQDSIIWNSLKKADFLNLAIGKFKGNPKLWTPINLALLISGEDHIIEDHDISRVELSEEYKKNSIVAFKEQTGENPPKMDLRLAGLLAFYLITNPQTTKPADWKTTLACLYGIETNSNNYLLTLDPENIVHVLLSHPFTNDELTQIIKPLINKLDPLKRFRILVELSNQRFDITTKLAQDFIDTFPQNATDIIGNYFDQIIGNINSHVVQAEIHSILNDNDKKIQSILEALDTSKKLNTKLVVQLINSKIGQQEINEAKELWESNKTSVLPSQNAEIIITLNSQGYSKVILEWFGPDPNQYVASDIGSPEQLFAESILLVHQGSKDEAYDKACKSLREYQRGDVKDQTSLLQLAQLFSKLNKHHESVQAIIRYLEIQPNDFNAIMQMVESYLQIKETSMASQTAHLAVALNPESIRTRQILAKSLESDGQWAEALIERDAIIRLKSEPALSDFHALASCALKANQPEKTATICQKLLGENPDNAEANLLLGNAYLSLEDFQKSEYHLKKATKISPNSVKSWISLVNLYHMMGQDGLAKETILTAANAIPDSPEIQLAIGKEYYNEIAYTQALHSFERADKLVKAHEGSIEQTLKSEIAEYYGKTLHQLGHTKEAFQILKVAYDHDPDHSEIPHTYAKLLLALELADQAHDILSILRLRHPDNGEVCIDYAKSCLTTKSNIDEAKKCLLELLENEPQNHVAKVLLAEAYELVQEFDLAKETYEEVLISPIQEDPTWITRVSKGLGRVLLRLNNPEYAITILNNALLHNDDDPDLLKTLSDAYSEAEHKDKSISIAKRVLHLEPDSDKNLDWFVNKLISLGAGEQAIQTLNTLIESSPSRPSALTKLGWLYLYEDNPDKAWNIYDQVKKISDVDPEDLYIVSQGFLAINDTSSALECLDKAISIGEYTENGYDIPKYYQARATTQQIQGNLQGALDSLNDSLEKFPVNPTIIENKAIILFEMEKLQEAIDCLEIGVDKYPQNKTINLLLLNFYRLNGDLGDAVKLAFKFFQVDGDPNSWDINASNSAIFADLADAMIQSTLAKDILAKAVFTGDNLTSDELPYYCLMAKNALEAKDDLNAASCITSALTINPKHPKVLALQARLTCEQGDYEGANQLLQQAIQRLGNYTNKKLSTVEKVRLYPSTLVEQPASLYLDLADVCLLFRHWDVAIYLLQEAIKIAPNEPRSHLDYAKALVLRAEHQHTCQELGIIYNAPGLSASAEFAHSQFESAIFEATRLVAQFNYPTENFSAFRSEAESTIATWMTRGQAIFKPCPEHADALTKLPKNQENLATLIAILRSDVDIKKAQKISREIFNEMGNNISKPRLYGEISLTLSSLSPDIANAAIESAIKISEWYKTLDLPIYYLIRAEIASHQEDQETQLQAIQAALAIWPNEPNWLVIVADLLLKNSSDDDSSLPLQYLKRATSLDPKTVDHHLKLYDLHNQLGNPGEALRVLEEATQIIPKEPKLWLKLAKTYHHIQDIPQAIRCAKIVLQIDPQMTDANILLARIALEVENPETAFKYLDDVLSKEPDNGQALLVRSRIYKKLQKPQEALDAIELAVEKLPNSIPIQLERINLVREVLGNSEAIKIIKTLNKEEPNNPLILFTFAEILSAIGKQDEAIRFAQESLSYAPDVMEKDELIKLLRLLGSVFRKSGQLDQAIQYFSDAIELTQDNPEPYIDLGRCYQEQRQPEKAIQLFQNAIKIAPKDPRSYYFVGLVYKDLKDYENAEMMLQNASKIAPNDLNYRRQLGAVMAINLVHSHQEETSFATTNESIET